VPADFDGDKKADLAVYRPGSGSWFVLLSGSGFTTWINRKWGAAPQDGVAGQDTPVVGDYDADQKADFAVYRPSSGVWYVLRSETGWTQWWTVKWGVNTAALPADYVGDGKPDKPVPADYDADGRTDFAVFRPSLGFWFIMYSSTAYSTYQVERWGLASDSLVPADYDGDGRAEIAVYRPSSGRWYIRRLGKDNWYIDWGMSGDVATIAK
jgi:hypothetical protein